MLKENKIFFGLNYGNDEFKRFENFDEAYNFSTKNKVSGVLVQFTTKQSKNIEMISKTLLEFEDGMIIENFMGEQDVVKSDGELV